MSGRQAAARLCRLGFAGRQALLNYKEYGEEFLRTLQIARLRIECHYEQLLQDPNCKPAAAIFALKNLGWRDDSRHVADDDSLPVEPPIVHLTVSREDSPCR